MAKTYGKTRPSAQAQMLSATNATVSATMERGLQIMYRVTSGSCVYASKRPWASPILGSRKKSRAV
jgi:hypothetical protein